MAHQHTGIVSHTVISGYIHGPDFANHIPLPLKLRIF
jgi:hypothetical protein